MIKQSTQQHSQTTKHVGFVDKVRHVKSHHVTIYSKSLKASFDVTRWTSSITSTQEFLCHLSSVHGASVQPFGTLNLPARRKVVWGGREATLTIVCYFASASFWQRWTATPASWRKSYCATRSFPEVEKPIRSSPVKVDKGMEVKYTAFVLKSMEKVSCDFERSQLSAQMVL